MRLDIEPEVFASSDELSVIKLIGLAIDGRHDWRPSLPVAMHAEQFVARLPVRALTEYIQKMVEEAVNPAPPAVAVVPVTADELPVILADLSKPAVLVVENRLGDGGFVRAVAAALRDQRIIDALKNDWLRFSNGGGCGQMPDIAADECKVFAVLIRVAVLFDSDRTAPEQRSPNHDKTERVRAAGVREVHLLSWRMMENYVPFPVWTHHFPTKTETIDSLRTVIPRQRGYLHLKHEFVGKRGRMPAPLIPEDMQLTEDDFAELGDDVLPELRELLAMIHRIL